MLSIISAILLGAVCLGICLVTGQFVGSSKDTPTAAVASTNSSAQQPLTPPTEQSILTAVNAERAKVGVAPLQLHPSVSKAAQLKADDMIARNYRHHELPEDKNTIATSEMLSYISLCSVYSENFVYNDYAISSKGAMSWWLNSPSHKAAMLDPKYTYTGIGVGDGKLVVQWFCVAR